MTEPKTGSTQARTVVTFGTFDVLHLGHLRMLERAAEHGNRLVVGVSSDALTIAKKSRPPVFPLEERLALVAALRCVDEAFVEESLEAKRDYLLRYQAQVFVIGDDWAGVFDDMREVCEVRYLERTPGISTTATIERIRA